MNSNTLFLSKKRPKEVMAESAISLPDRQHILRDCDSLCDDDDNGGGDVARPWKKIDAP
jgi:hypothetical protein